MKFFFLILIIIVASLQSFSQSGQWAWMKGDTIFNALPVWGTKGVGDPVNNPAIMYAYYHWQDSAGNFWVYGGNSNDMYGGYNAVWKFDLQSQNWIWMHGDNTINSPEVFGTQGIPSPDNTPGARIFSGLCWTDNNGKFWLYSGMNNGADVWMYNPSSNEWTWMQGSQTYTSPVYGTYQVSSPYNTPGTNAEDNASWVDADNNLWFYGGQSESNSALWMYNTGINEWTWMGGSNVSNAAPVYGTLGVPSTSNMPGGRWCYGSWKDDAGNFMLFGGHVDEDMFTNYERNDLWKYNITDQTWTWLGGDSATDQQGIEGSECEFSPLFIPGARFENRGCIKDSCGNIWMYGGYTFGSITYCDLWIYRPATNDWASLGDTAHKPHYGIMGVPAQNNTPGQRYGSVTWFDHSGNMWLFGGTGIVSPFNFNFYKQDLWKYIPDTTCEVKACLATQVNDITDLMDQVNVYPNPSSGIINIEIPSAENVKIEIRNAIGQLIFSSEEKNYHHQFNMQIDLSAGLHSGSEVSSGIYFITLKTEKEYWVKKVIITM